MAAILALAPIIFGLLAVSALFSAAETALTGASRARMHQLEREGDRAARRVNRLLSDQETMIGAVLLGNNLINILASALATEVLTRAIPGALGVAVATGVMTVLVLVFAEVLPKTLAILRSDDVARFLSAPTLVVVRVFGPIIYRHPVGGPQDPAACSACRLGMEMDVLAAHEEIRGAVEYHHSEGLVETHDRWMLGGVLDLARDGRQRGDGPPQGHRHDRRRPAAARDPGRGRWRAPHTRLPLYRDEPENIVGVLHAKDLLQALADADGGSTPSTSRAIIREPWFIPETTSLKDQLAAFLKRRTHFALVVDEYGALQGLVTLEDILEEIVGEIEDEHDVGVSRRAARQPDGSVSRRRLGDHPRPQPRHELGPARRRGGDRRGPADPRGASASPTPARPSASTGHRFRVPERKGNQITRLQIWPADAARELTRRSRRKEPAWPRALMLSPRPGVWGASTA